MAPLDRIQASDQADKDIAIPAAGTGPPAKQPRLFYVDWLRALVIALVLAFHTIDLYFDYTYSAGLYAGIVNTPPTDPSRQVAIVVAQLLQSFFMGLMFLLSGHFARPSYAAKGPARFLADRALRLLVPLLAYDLLLQPLAFELARLAPAAAVYAPLREAPSGFAWYYSTKSRLGYGAGWFLVVLFLFDLAYAATRLIMAAAAAAGAALRRAAAGRAAGSEPPSGAASSARRAGGDIECGASGPPPAAPAKGSACGAPLADCQWHQKQQQQQHAGDQQQPAAEQPAAGAAAARGAFSCRATAAGALAAAALIAGLTVLVRVGVMIPLGLQISMWTLQYIQLQPAYLPQYAAAFVLGVAAHKADALRRLPARVGPAAAAAAAVLAAGGGVLMTYVPGSNFGHELERGPSAAYVAAYAAWEQCYAVAAWLALLLCFRACADQRGGRVGGALAGAAYAVYVVHVPVLSALGAAFAPLPWHPAAKCAAVAPALAASSWAIGVALRLVPGVKRVL